MTRNFEILLNALLMLTDIRAPIVVKDIPTDTPNVRRYIPVLSAGDFDLSDWRERIEWQGDGCDADLEAPFYDEALEAEKDMGTIFRLIPEDGEEWADALKAVVSDAFSKVLDGWMTGNPFIHDDKYNCEF